ncbi:hypothetical protein KCP78_15635 [Salmonella enterica subsp. enterica]|nr:hypothetical protein KCP78_15635 [Salmonella enterica subsp. enterica]
MCVKTVPLDSGCIKEAGLTASLYHAVAYRSPGPAGALLVGVTVGRSLAFARNVLAIPVQYMEGICWRRCWEDNS